MNNASSEKRKNVSRDFVNYCHEYYDLTHRDTHDLKCFAVKSFPIKRQLAEFRARSAPVTFFKHEIVIGSFLGKFNAKISFAHEFSHYIQYKEQRLRREGMKVIWENTYFHHTDDVPMKFKEYFNLPWEIEAHKNANDIVFTYPVKRFKILFSRSGEKK